MLEIGFVASGKTYLHVAFSYKYLHHCIEYGEYSQYVVEHAQPSVLQTDVLVSDIGEQLTSHYSQETIIFIHCKLVGSSEVITNARWALIRKHVGVVGALYLEQKRAFERLYAASYINTQCIEWLLIKE